MNKVLTIFLFFAMSSAQANVILDESTVVQIGDNASSVDYTFFSVTTAGLFDISATRTSGTLDTFIRLFDDDGILDAGDQITFNDDGGPGLNSLISGVSLGLGDYVLAVGDFFLELNSAISGINIDDSFPETGTAAIRISSDNGFAVLTNQVPTPTPFALLGLGLAMIAATRRRKES